MLVLKIYQLKKLLIIRYQLEKQTFVNIISNFFEVGCAVLLLWANTFSPFGINHQIQKHCEPFFYFLPYW
jgi:hypothetical protein